MSSPEQIVITSVGLALPGAGTADELINARHAAAEPVDPAARIGRRGLRYHDRATQLALVAARDALRTAKLLPADGEQLTEPAETVAVVGSSNLGNLDTACEVATQIAEESVWTLSPMRLPNASSNVVASTVALRFGLRGPNVMLCNGATSGLDAVHWAMNLVAAERAQRALVVGVETHNEVVQGLLGRRADELLDGAVALVVEGAGTARSRGVRPAAALTGYQREASLAACVKAVLSHAPDATVPGIWFTPEGYRDDATDSRASDRAGDGDAAASALVGRQVPRHDVSAAFGLSSGAHGVLQCAAATGRLTAGGTGSALVTSGDDTCDAVAGLLVVPVGAPA